MFARPHYDIQENAFRNNGDIAGELTVRTDRDYIDMMRGEIITGNSHEDTSEVRIAEKLTKG